MENPSAVSDTPPSSPVVGRHYRTGSVIAIHHAAGHITAIQPAKDAPGDLPWIAPPLVDLQVNGFAGVDFQQDAVALTDLETACNGLLAAGCGRFLLTLITDEWSRMKERLRRLRCLRLESPILEATIAGWHIEGPFLSSEPGFHGAHPPECMLDPTPEHMATLHEIVGQDPLLLTLAPERRGAGRAIREAVARGFRVSAGHSNATTQHLIEAVSAGARGFTHLGNACPQLLDRHDNVLWRVLDLVRQAPPRTERCRPGAGDAGTEPDQSVGFGVSLIPDGLHLPPTLFRVLHAAAGPANVWYVSDAMAGAGAPPGLATLGRLQLQVGSDGIVRHPGRSNFAGSALRPIDGVFRAAAMLQTDWADCWDRFSAAPAAWMGWPDVTLRVGASADLCVFDLPRNTCAEPGPSQEKGLVRRVLIAGQEVYRRGSDR